MQWWRNKSAHLCTEEEFSFAYYEVPVQMLEHEPWHALSSASCSKWRWKSFFQKASKFHLLYLNNKALAPFVLGTLICLMLWHFAHFRFQMTSNNIFDSNVSWFILWNTEGENKTWVSVKDIFICEIFVILIKEQQIFIIEQIYNCMHASFFNYQVINNV